MNPVTAELLSLLDDTTDGASGSCCTTEPEAANTAPADWGAS